MSRPLRPRFRTRPLPPALVLALAATLSFASGARARAPEAAASPRVPATDSVVTAPRGSRGADLDPEDQWLRPPFGDPLLTDVDLWRSRGERPLRVRPTLDYNRVDPLRAGAAAQWMPDERLVPRIGARLEYAFGRDRVLYGFALEQPLDPGRRLGLGVSMDRLTDHSELQQVEDVENSVTMLFGRTDNRDYFEREGIGAWLSWRVPDFSTVSVNLRRDQYRSLRRDPWARSLFFQDRPLRDNPPVDEGEGRTLTLRLERLAHRTRRTRAGLYHWIEIERSGGALGGDFRYIRSLADVRSVLRLSPTTTLALRGVAGHTGEGALPFQKQFTVGGVDGLRAHSFAQYRGDQMLLGQAEYLISLWRLRGGGYVSRLQVLSFVDAGRAWSNPAHRFDPAHQNLQADGGFGLGASDNGLRIYFARNLQRARSSLVISARLQRPF